MAFIMLEARSISQPGNKMPPVFSRLPAKCRLPVNTGSDIDKKPVSTGKPPVFGEKTGETGKPAKNQLFSEKPSDMSFLGEKRQLSKKTTAFFIVVFS